MNIYFLIFRRILILDLLVYWIFNGLTSIFFKVIDGEVNVETGKLCDDEILPLIKGK